MEKQLPKVHLTDVIDDKELIKVVRHVLEPAIEALVWRTAMIMKQSALCALTPTESPTDEQA